MRLSRSGFRFLVVVFIAVAALAGAKAGAADPPVSPADRAAIRDVVQSQLDAFQKDDGERAFSFASPTIRSMFMTSTNFMDMVKSGYAPVYRPRQVQFGPVETIEGVIVQHVFLVGPDGDSVDALYSMQRQSDGSWRIDGCELRQGGAA